MVGSWRKVGDDNGYFFRFCEESNRLPSEPSHFFKSLPSTRSPNAQLSNKLTLSPNHWANELKLRKNIFNHQKIFQASLLSTKQSSTKIPGWSAIYSTKGRRSTSAAMALYFAQTIRWAVEPIRWSMSTLKLAWIPTTEGKFLRFCYSNLMNFKENVLWRISTGVCCLY